MDNAHALTLATAPCPVQSHNEWDPLEEVIVGRLDHAMVFPTAEINRPTVSEDWEGIVHRLSGRREPPYPYAPELVAAAQANLDEFIGLLTGFGVRVRRPDPIRHDRPYASPAWSMPHGFCTASPRDPILVIGDEIIETPMADRSRYFEAYAFRTLFKEYFRQGARWTAAPRPELTEHLFDPTVGTPKEGDTDRWVTTEFEPVFDAADFVRCGRDLFVQRSHVTNAFGIEWLRRHLGEGYRIHEIPVRNPWAIHLDTTFVPLAEGRVLVSPDYVDVDRLPPVLKNWEILVAPKPACRTNTSGAVSEWISINVLSLDGRHVVVERQEEPLIQALRDWGFVPVPCTFDSYYPFFGAFHCSTLDIRRRGSLRSHF